MAAVASFAMTRLLMALQGRTPFPIDMTAADNDISPATGSVGAAMYSPSLVPLYLLTGLAMGLLGPGYTRLKVALSDRFAPFNNHPRHRLLLGGAVGCLSALLFFLPGPLTRLSLLQSCRRLLSTGDLVSAQEAAEQGLVWWGAGSVVPPEAALLAVASGVRFLASVLDTSLSLPSGDFMCLFATGAGLGRLMGLAFRAALPGRKKKATDRQRAAG